MAICPVANSKGCKKCAVVNVCFLKTVLGNYAEEESEPASEATTVNIRDDDQPPPDS